MSKTARKSHLKVPLTSNRNPKTRAGNW